MRRRVVALELTTARADAEGHSRAGREKGAAKR